MKRLLSFFILSLVIAAHLAVAGPPPPFIFPPQTSSGSMVYPGSGIPSSTGAGWDASYSLDTDLTSVSGSDDTLPSAKAAKTYADTKRTFSGAATALTADSATPALTSGTWFYKTANTTGTTYTNFTGGSAGWHIFVLVDDSNSTFDFTASSLNNAYGVDYPAASGDLIECLHNGTNWTCLIWGANAADGARYLAILNNTSRSPTAASMEVYPEGNVWKVNQNGTEYAMGYMVASGTSALGTGAINSGACATVVTTSATGTATTDVVAWGFNADPTSTTGYSASANGMLTIIAYPTANNVNFKVCNNTAASITPGAVTLNWRVTR